MATIVENLERWEQHPWALQGDEWSPGRSPQGTRLFWQRTIYPRIQRLVPTGTIVEIGPGFGRWTHFLREHCEHLILVDLSSRCIQACADRFAGDARIEYHVNDGRSLDMIADGSVDFIFSFDSLVHAEADAIGAYVQEAARILKPRASAFLHHSNLGAFVNRRTGRIPGFVGPRNWRAESMSAGAFRQLCDQSGVYCRSQELINWIGRGRRADRHRLNGRAIALTDCLSVVTNERAVRAPRVIVNRAFVEEWRSAVWMVDVYARAEEAPQQTDSVDLLKRLRRKPATLLDVWRRNGWCGTAAVVRQRVGDVSDFAGSLVRTHLRGLAIRWLTRRTPV